MLFIVGNFSLFCYGMLIDFIYENSIQIDFAALESLKSFWL